jgi:hypothetical protein
MIARMREDKMRSTRHSAGQTPYVPRLLIFLAHLVMIIEGNIVHFFGVTSNLLTGSMHTLAKRR